MTMIFRRTPGAILAKLENILMFVIIWACILSIHYPYKRSSTSIIDQMSKTVKVDVKTIENKAKVEVKKKDLFDEDVDFIQPDLAARVQKELEESRKEQAKELQKERQRKKYGELYSTHTEDEALKWFSQRPKVDYKHSDGKHSQLPKYLITGDSICSKGRPDILFYIHSKLGNDELRNGIRQTFGHPDNFKKLNVKTVFILGKPTSDAEKEKIRKENDANKDIIQTDFDDTHRNLSLKVLTFLQWVMDYCSKPPPVFIVKVDDDFFVNPFMLIEDFISDLWDKPSFVACHYKENAAVVRNKNSKWYIPESAYPKKDPDVFPKTCSGYTAIFPGDMIPALHSISIDKAILPVDDAYLFSHLYLDMENPEYVQILDKMTLNKDTGLEDYKSKSRLQYMSVSSWGNSKENLDILWKGTLSHLTVLGKQLINEKRLK